MSWKVFKPSSLVKSLKESTDCQTKDILRPLVEREFYIKRIDKAKFKREDFDNKSEN